MNIRELIDKLTEIAERNSYLMDVVMYVPGDDPGIWDFDINKDQFKLSFHEEKGVKVKHLEIHIY